MTDSNKASPTKRHVGLAFAATGLALVMALGAPLQASAASSELWSGNSAKGSWVSGRADVSTKIRVYAQAPALTQRVGVRVNGMVSRSSQQCSRVKLSAACSSPLQLRRWTPAPSY